MNNNYTLRKKHALDQLFFESFNKAHQQPIMYLIDRMEPSFRTLQL
jgi:hypothetical protein